MALRQSTRCSGDQPCKWLASKRQAPQLPGRYKKTPAKKNTSLTASAIEVSGSNDEPAVTKGTDGNKGNSSIKGQQGKVGGENKCDDSKDADIGKSGYDFEVSDGNGDIVGTNWINVNDVIDVNKGKIGKTGNDGNGNINGDNSNNGDTRKCVNDEEVGVGDDNNGNGGINDNEVNEGGNNGVPSDDLNSEDDITGASEDRDLF